MSTADALRDAVAEAACAIGAPPGFAPVIERPRDPSFGDWATNAAMVLAKPLGRKPRDVAQSLIDAMRLPRDGVRSAEIAGPGFINFRMDTAAVAQGLAGVVAANERYGRGTARAGERVDVEFVSANPTGPLHVGHGRQAALGDAIASLLEWQGADVTREFYYNDAGAQIMNLTRSVQARIAELRTGAGNIPEGGYHGEYIREIATKYVESHPSDPDGRDDDAVRKFAVAEGD